MLSRVPGASTRGDLDTFSPGELRLFAPAQLYQCCAQHLISGSVSGVDRQGAAQSIYRFRPTLELYILVGQPVPDHNFGGLGFSDCQQSFEPVVGHDYFSTSATRADRFACARFYLQPAMLMTLRIWIREPF